ncbi:M48 family metallopeptidase [Nonomuraea sp. SYSU D8015]|uniref:M48 family metallopeptidase n=1 Tax=Nonomuraea sp. SYSU D8015 TaxID=2593644 RepID=UPI001660D9C0|nr:M48 family metallopeptidase [Nonomuraea sp. SYSU D8015]
MKRLLALVLALLVHLITLGFVALGAWAVIAHADSFLAWLLGGLSLAVGWVLRPRLNRLPADAEVLDRAAAPELYAVADRVADRIGVKRPRRVAIRDLATETWYDRVGLPRTPTLVVGLPLWLALPPRQRVTLLAVAYARVPTGEELIVGGALDTLEAWRDALMEAGPLRVREEAQTKITAASLGVADQPGTTYEVAGFLGRLLGRVFGGPVLLARYALTRLARAAETRTRLRQQALARRAASDGDLAELEELAGGGYLAPMQAAALRGESVASIRQRALARFRLTDDGVLTSAPESELLGTRESERIDEELSAHYTRAIRGFGLIT